MIEIAFILLVIGIIAIAAESFFDYLFESPNQSKESTALPPIPNSYISPSPPQQTNENAQKTEKKKEETAPTTYYYEPSVCDECGGPLDCSGSTCHNCVGSCPV